MIPLVVVILTAGDADGTLAIVWGSGLSAVRWTQMRVGKIERDQAEDYARRKGWPLSEAERWLAPILNYEPERRDTAA